MRILFTVCARAGSKGVIGKNFRSFLGYPLLYYTFSAIDLYAKRHPEVCTNVAFNTDSREMDDMVKKLKMEVSRIPRRPELAGDSAAKIDVIADTWRSMKKMTGKVFDMVVDCDVTSPLRTVEDIERVIKKLQEGNWDVVFTVTKARRNPYFNMVKKFDDGHVERVIPSKFTARQQAPVMFDMNASLYVYRPSFLAEGAPLLDGRCGMTVMPDTGVLDLDVEEDFKLMKVIAGYLLSQNNEMREIREHIAEME